jgi:hypothetical protein
MTEEEALAAKMAKAEWVRRLETQYFKHELEAEYAAATDALVSKANTPGTTIDTLIRLGAKAAQLKQTIDKIKV